MINSNISNFIRKRNRKMKVQKIRLPYSTQFRWIVIANDYLPVESISQYLFFLESVDKSPNTIRSYAHHLKIYWEYIIKHNLDWKEVKISDLARFVSYLNGLIEDNVIHLNRIENRRSARTINQIVAAVSNFYQYHHRMGTVDEISFYQWKKSYFSQRVFKPLLHHLSKSKKRGASILKLKEKKILFKVVETDIIKEMVASCKHIRDKLLICLLYETGCRIGQALGLRHEDVETFNNVIKIKPRNDNLNQARSKSSEENTIHVSQELMRLYCDYYIQEFSEVDSDYVFVALWEGEIGKPLSYSSVITLFQRLSKKIGVHVTPHMFRHTHATELVKAGWGMAHVQKRLGHQDIQTTINTYTHLSDADLKEKYQEFLKKKERHS